MEIKEKLFTKVYKDDEIYYCYGPDICDLDIDMLYKAGMDCWLLKKPIENADESDIIECVDPIKVWFSDFQIYKFILKKMYGPKFPELSGKRFDFLKANGNRFHLIHVLVGDYGCFDDEFSVTCFDTLNFEYINLSIFEDEFKITKLTSNEKEPKKIIELVKKGEIVDQNKFDGRRDGFTYVLNKKEYEPLFLLYKFLRSFYFYYVIDGCLISWF